ncbi:MAG: hypothetical protein RLZZ442_1531, partial [Cyanobacteriota bacterium]
SLVVKSFLMLAPLSGARQTSLVTLVVCLVRKVRVIRLELV